MAERKFGKIINQETKEVLLGAGVDDEYYAAIGMQPLWVEAGCDGKWYLEGAAPQKPEPTLSDAVAGLEMKYTLPRPMRTTLLALRKQGAELDGTLMARVDEIESLAAPLRAQEAACGAPDGEKE